MKFGGALNGFAVGTLIARGRSGGFFSGGDHEWVPAPPQAVMRDGFILLLTVFLGSLVAAAQTPTPQTVPAQERVAPITSRLQTLPVPSPAARSFALSEEPGKSARHFSYLFVRAYERQQGLESLSPIHRLKTLFLTQSSVSLFQLWGGRLRLDGFTSRLHIQNVQLGAPAVGSPHDICSPRQGYPGGPRSIGFYGLSLSLPFGRNTETRCPTHTWRCIARFVSAMAQ